MVPTGSAVDEVRAASALKAVVTALAGERVVSAVAAEDEYLPRANYGFRLATRGQLDSAVIHLRRATAIEPLAVESHLMLGLVFDAQGDTAQAREAFARFAALAARGHPRLERVRARLAR